MKDRLEKWRGFLPDEELATYRKAGFGRRIGLGRKPALLNIDTTYLMVDPAYSQCEREMPDLIRSIVRLTAAFRRLELPIYYVRRDDRRHPTYRGMWNLKLGTASDHEYSHDPRADQWPADYAPRSHDVIVKKNKPSCFFGTPLEALLRYDEVDTLVVVGTSTSGCVRAGVTDAFSHNFRVVVVAEAVGDRSLTAHRANLFDMDMKFADVEGLEDVLHWVEERHGEVVGTIPRDR